MAAYAVQCVHNTLMLAPTVYSMRSMLEQNALLQFTRLFLSARVKSGHARLATLTCRASIEFPPFSMLSLIKNGQTVATSSSGMLQITTKSVNANPFGVHTCRSNASGEMFEEETFLKEQGLQPVGIVGQNINNLIICDHKICSLYQAND